MIRRIGKASSFADPKDIAAFNRCRRAGSSEKECFKVGDNGIGCWGDATTDLNRRFVAVPPEDMLARFGSIKAAKHAKIMVTIGGRTYTCELGDRMPRKENIKNGAVIDLAPGAAACWNLKPPFLVACSWEWK